MILFQVARVSLSGPYDTGVTPGWQQLNRGSLPSNPTKMVITLDVDPADYELVGRTISIDAWRNTQPNNTGAIHEGGQTWQSGHYVDKFGNVNPPIKLTLGGVKQDGTLVLPPDWVDWYWKLTGSVNGGAVRTGFMLEIL